MVALKTAHDRTQSGADAGGMHNTSSQPPDQGFCLSGACGLLSHGATTRTMDRGPWSRTVHAGHRQSARKDSGCNCASGGSQRAFLRNFMPRSTPESHLSLDSAS